MKKIIGAGVLLITPSGTLLLQERDNNATLHPGKIAAFGGGIEGVETSHECAKREMKEELDLEIDVSQLQSLGLFESRHESGIFNEIFTLRQVDLSDLSLKEGAGIVELTKEEALEHSNVTDYTKRFIRLL